MTITCLHTAQIHVAGFARLFADEGWEGPLDHILRPDLLQRARQDGAQSVAQDMRAVLEGVSPADVVLCSCSTLGPLFEQLGGDRVVRIDRPAMEMAAGIGKAMLVICLESTRGPTVDLFEAYSGGTKAQIVHCPTAWPYFEAGDMAGFHGAIVKSVGAAMADAPDTQCIVLAQASMQGAAPALTGFGVPVLSTPVLAVQRAIALARRLDH